MLKSSIRKVMEIANGQPRNKAVIQLLEKALEESVEVTNCSMGLVILMTDDGLVLGGLAGTNENMDRFQTAVLQKSAHMFDEGRDLVQQETAKRKALKNKLPDLGEFKL